MRTRISESEKSRILGLYNITKNDISEQIRSATDLVTIKLGPYGSIQVGVKPDLSNKTLKYFIMGDGGEMIFDIQEFFTRKFANLGRKVNYHDFLNPLLSGPVFRGDFKSSRSIIEALNVLQNQIKPSIERNIQRNANQN